MSSHPSGRETAEAFVRQLLDSYKDDSRNYVVLGASDDAEVELIPGLMYRFHLADTATGELFALTLYLEVGRLGGALWEQEMRTLERLANFGHPALPRLRDGGHLDGRDGRSGAAYIRTVTWGEAPSPQVFRELFSSDRGLALPQLWMLADALALMADSQMSHRGLWPGALEVDNPGTLRAVSMSRFEMSALLANTFRSRTASAISLNDLRQLYLVENPVSRLYMPPERLRFLFDKPDGDIGGPLGDVFSLGMIALHWLSEDDVFAGALTGTYDEVIASQRRAAQALRRQAPLPGGLTELLNTMLDETAANRPRAHQVAQTFAQAYSDARAVLSGDLATEPYLVAYMPEESNKTLYTWGLIPERAEANPEAIKSLIESDITGAEMLHSPKGAQGFVPGDEKSLSEATVVIVGSQLTWFCNYFYTPSNSGNLVQYKTILLVRYVQYTDFISTRLDKLRVSGLVSRVPIVEAVAMPRNTRIADYQSRGRPSWSERITHVATARDLTKDEEEYLASLDWYLNYQQALLDARTYAYTKEPGGGSEIVLRWDSVRDRARKLGRDKVLSMRTIASTYRPALGDFIDEMDNESPVPLTVHVAAEVGGLQGREKRILTVRHTQGYDCVVVKNDRGVSVPEEGWLRIATDSGTFAQIGRQRAARGEMTAQRVLLNQLINPHDRVRLTNKWDNKGGLLQGEGRAAVVQMLKHEALFALQGPPGTGKTEVTAQAVADWVEEEETTRVLVSAQSHDALENLAARVVDKLGLTTKPSKDANLNRIALRVTSKGQREMAPRVREFTAENLVEGVIGHSTRQAQRWLKASGGKAPELCAVVSDWIAALPSSRLELSRRAQAAANIVFATTGVATRARLTNGATDEPFDWVLVEEAGRAWPTELALPLVRGVRWTLVGDHAQIGAYSRADVEKLLIELQHSQDERLKAMYDARERYSEYFSTFGRLFDADREGAPRLTLTEQYRMHQDIADMVGSIFYSNSGGLVTRRAEHPHPLEEPAAFLDSRLVWVDTGEAERSIGYWSNDHEADLCARIIRDLRPCPQPPTSASRPTIAVTTPYRDQRAKIASRLGDLESSVFTIDGFQGREADIVIASLVRDRVVSGSSEISSIGHLASRPRINVLMSRARELLIVVGRLSLYEHHAGETWEEIVGYFRRSGTIVDGSQWRIP